MRFLAFTFNWLVLNLALLVGSALVVTAPVAVAASVRALDSWRAAGEDRVVRSFLSSLRSGDAWAVTLRVGVPLAVLASAVEEVHYFWRDTAGAGALCLGFGVAALLVSSSAAPYAVVLGARHPGAPALDLWQECLRLSLRNALVTGPLFLVEGAALLLVGLADPALLLFGLPLCWVFLVRATVALGLRRAGPGGPGGPG